MEMEEWKVSSSLAGGKKEYQIYKLRNPKAADYEGNRTYAMALFDTEEKAQAMADKWNSYNKENQAAFHARTK